MSWTLILPATAVVTALLVMTGSFLRLEREAVLLRASMRRARAAAVATDELHRLTSDISARAIQLDATKRLRRHRARRQRQDDSR